jgi:hypothetical protein
MPRRRVKTAIRTNLEDTPDCGHQLAIAISRWAYAEETLTHILAHLLEAHPDRAEIVFYASNSERFRTDLIRALAKAYIPEDEVRAELFKALKKFGDLVGTRNLYVHGLYKYDAKLRLYVVGTRHGPLDWFSPKDRVTIKKLEKFSTQIGNAEQALLDALGKMRYASAHRSRPRYRGRKFRSAQSPKSKNAVP